MVLVMFLKDHPLFIVYFKHQYNFAGKRYLNVKNYNQWLRFKLRTLAHESPTITTRPLLPPCHKWPLVIG